MSTHENEFIWHNGQLVPWHEATTHVLSHALHYGSSVFEGVRLYKTDRGPCFFRLGCHTRRLYDSAKLYRMDVPYSEAQLNAACHEVVAANKLTDGAYIRPIVFRGAGGLGVAPSPGSPVEVSVAAFEWGAYLGDESLEQGVDVCISSWQRLAPNTMPTAAKAGGNYLSGQLIAMEAQRLGFAEGIGLTVDGTISEGAGENLFVIKDGRIITPPASSSILSGITRDSVIKLAHSLGLEVVEQTMQREILYLADELFFTGTAVEVTPIRSVDRIEVGNGRRGPVTERVQQAFFGLFNGETNDRWGWLEPLGQSGSKSAAVAGVVR